MTTRTHAMRWVWTALFIVILLAAGARAARAQEGQDPGQTLPPRIHMPLILAGVAAPPGPAPSYGSVPVASAPTDRPAHEHPDLNLAVRGHELTTAPLSLQEYGGGTDSNAPQIAGMFSPQRLPGFSSAHRVYEWDWDCGPNGCRGHLEDRYPVTLLGMAVSPGEEIHFPSRGPQIYGGGYKALVLYASQERITLKYTREDNVVRGYTVHIEGLTVEPALLELYNRLDSRGRDHLPALRDGERIGWAGSGEIRAAVRDNGQFMDPRARKDWWQDY